MISYQFRRAVEAVWRAMVKSLANGEWLRSRNAAGSGDVNLLRLNESDVVELGVGPSCRAYHNAAQAVASTTYTPVAFNSEEWDTDSIHDNATNNGRLTCRTAGKYLVTVMIDWAALSAATELLLQKNGSTVRSWTTPPSGASNKRTDSWTTLIDLAASDYLSVQVAQYGAGSVNVNPWWTAFEMVRVCG